MEHERTDGKMIIQNFGRDIYRNDFLGIAHNLDILRTQGGSKEVKAMCYSHMGEVAEHLVKNIREDESKILAGDIELQNVFQEFLDEAILLQKAVEEKTISMDHIAKIRIAYAKAVEIVKGREESEL